MRLFLQIEGTLARTLSDIFEFAKNDCHAAPSGTF